MPLTLRLHRRSRSAMLFGIAIAIGCVSPAMNPQVAVNAPDVAAVPSFRSDSVTTGDNGDRLAAVVGTVVDSVTGRPLEAATVVVRPRGTSENRIGRYADGHGGFVVGRIKPGSYQIVARRIGWLAVSRDWDARAGKIDKVQFRLPRAVVHFDPSQAMVESEPAGKHESIGATSTCLPADSGGTDALDGYRRDDTTAIASRIKWRTNLGLARIPTSQILLVNDESLCRRALEAFRAEFRGHDEILDMKAVYLIRYGGDRFIIGNPHGPHAGEWRTEIVADGSFRTIALAGH